MCVFLILGNIEKKKRSFLPFPFLNVANNKWQRVYSSSIIVIFLSLSRGLCIFVYFFVLPPKNSRVHKLAGELMERCTASFAFGFARSVRGLFVMCLWQSLRSWKKSAV